MGDWLHDFGSALSGAWNGATEAVGDFVTGGKVTKFKNALQTWDPQRDEEIGGGTVAPFAGEAASYNKELADASKAWGPLAWPAQQQQSSGVLRDPWTNSLTKPGQDGYDKVKAYYDKLNGFGSAGTGGQDTAAPRFAGDPSGPVVGVGNPKPTPQSNPLTAQGAPDAHAAAILALLKAQQARADKIYGDINGIQNPWDTQGQTFQAALGRNLDDTTRNYAGANQRLMTTLGQRGQAGGVGASVAQGNLERQRGQALSDVQSGMFKDALQGSTDFAFKKAGALDSLARGNYGDAESTLASLMNASTGVQNYDRSQTFAEKTGTHGMDLQDKQFAHGVDMDAENLALQKSAQDLARQNGLDAKEASLWSNIVNTAGKFGPALLALIADGKLDIRKLLADPGLANTTPTSGTGGGSTLPPYQYPSGPYAPGYDPNGYQSDYGNHEGDWNWGGRS